MNPFKTLSLYLAILTLFPACASGPQGNRRIFVDSTTHENLPPDWVKATRTSWEQEDRVYFKAHHTIRGDERLNGCFDLARLDAKETVLSEISSEIRGSLDSAQQSLSEKAELVLGKVRSGEFRGNVRGLRFAEEYFERYQIGDAERVDCFSLASITKSDYLHLRNSILSGVIDADPRLKEALTRKQIQILSKDAVQTAADQDQPE